MGFIKKKPYAEIKEIARVEHMDVLRIDRTQYEPDGNHQFCLQIRTYKPITENGRGKKRDMTAHVDISVKELKEILNFIKSH